MVGLVHSIAFCAVFGSAYCCVTYPCKVLEWDDWVSGDVMSEIEEKTVLKKAYFITQIDGDEYSPDFFNSYCLDASKRSLSKCEVIDESRGSLDPVMRYVCLHNYLNT